MPKNTQSHALSIFLGMAVVILIGWMLVQLRFIFLPMVLGIFISFLLNPVVNYMTRFKVPRFLAVILTLFLAVCALTLVGTVVLQSLSSFQDQFPKYEDQIRQMIAQAKQLSRLDYGPINRDRVLAELGKLSLSSFVGSTMASFLSFLTYFVFTLVFAVFFMAGSHRLPDKIRRAFPPERAQGINWALESISQQFQRYILAKTLTSFITGGMMIIVCLLFGVDFPITWGFFTFLLNYIPTVGVLIASIPPPVIALIQHGTWVTPIWIIAVLIAVMMTLGNVIEPKILGESVNLSPLVTLFAIILWGWLWGPVGMLLSVPITAMIKFTCDHVEELRPIGVLMGSET